MSRLLLLGREHGPKVLHGGIGHGDPAQGVAVGGIRGGFVMGGKPEDTFRKGLAGIVDLGEIPELAVWVEEKEANVWLDRELLKKVSVAEWIEECAEKAAIVRTFNENVYRREQHALIKNYRAPRKHLRFTWQELLPHLCGITEEKHRFLGEPGCLQKTGHQGFWQEVDSGIEGDVMSVWY